MDYIICDDKQKSAEALKAKIIELEPNASVRVFSTLRALMFNIEDITERIDGVFMSIKPKAGNGVSGAEQLLTSHPEIKLVYYTTYATECLQEIYCVGSKALPVALLIKPIETRYLQNALAKIREKEKKPDILAIKCGSSVTYLNTEDIIYINSEKRKLLIRTADMNYEIYGKISEFCVNLPAHFLQCHKSFVVNLNHVSRITGWSSLEMADGSVIPISRTYKDNIKTAVTLFKP